MWFSGAQINSKVPSGPTSNVTVAESGVFIYATSICLASREVQKGPGRPSHMCILGIVEYIFKAYIICHRRLKPKPQLHTSIVNKNEEKTLLNIYFNMICYSHLFLPPTVLKTEAHRISCLQETLQEYLCICCRRRLNSFIKITQVMICMTSTIRHADVLCHRHFLFKAIHHNQVFSSSLRRIRGTLGQSLFEIPYWFAKRNTRDEDS